MKYDVLIIGGGLGGLECGYILSRAGQRVLILEQGRQPGGCLQSYCRKGMEFDTGFHYAGGLDEGQSLHAAFRHLGLLELPWRRLDADNFDCVTIDRHSFPFAQGHDAFANRLAEAFPAERAALHRYAGLLKRAARLQFAAFSPQSSDMDLITELMETPVYKYLYEHFKDPLLINVLSGASLKMELRPESLPLFAFLHGNGCFIESSWRLKGSGSLITDSLVQGIRAQGGEIVCQSEVQELVEKDGKLTQAVCTNGETYESRLFVSDIHPAQTCRMVRNGQRIKPLYRERIQCLPQTFGMFTVSLRFAPGKLRYFNRNHYIYRNPDVWTFHLDNRPVGGVLASCRVPEDGSGYTRQVDLLTPMNWEYCKAWKDRRDNSYEEMKKQTADECIALAESILPGLGEAETAYTSTPLTWNRYTLTPEGSAYGLRKDCRAALQTFLSPRTPIPNLFLTGQNVGLHGLHGVTMTAFQTCAGILGKDAVWKMLNGNCKDGN